MAQPIQLAHHTHVVTLPPEESKTTLKLWCAWDARLSDAEKQQLVPVAELKAKERVVSFHTDGTPQTAMDRMPFAFPVTVCACTSQIAQRFLIDFCTDRPAF